MGMDNVSPVTPNQPAPENEIALTPEFIEKLDAGVNYYAEKNLPKAIVTLREALELCPNNEKGHFYLALSYYENDNIEQAADELPLCGGYAPVKAVELIKGIAKKANIEHMKIINELPQKNLYFDILKADDLKELEERKNREFKARAEADEQLRKFEIEGHYEDFDADIAKAAPSNYFVPILMGILSVPAWGLGSLLSFNFVKALFRFALEYFFYYMYVNKDGINQWTITNINLAQFLGYSQMTNQLTSYIFPTLQVIFVLSGVFLSLQSFVIAFTDWYKALILGNITVINGTIDIYINIGFNHHFNVGDSFNVYTRAKNPTLKGSIVITRLDNETSAVEFRPNTKLAEIMEPKVGDIVKYKWY